MTLVSYTILSITSINTSQPYLWVVKLKLDCRLFIKMSLLVAFAGDKSVSIKLVLFGIDERLIKYC